MQILLIEPDRLLAETYRRWLETLGHAVQLVGSAQAAIHTSDKRAPDIVVLELQLAGHNGVEFLYEFRSYPEWQHIPILLHTLVPPASLQLDTKSLQALGIAGYLYKPTTSLSLLGRTIEEISGETTYETASHNNRHSSHQD